MEGLKLEEDMIVPSNAVIYVPPTELAKTGRFLDAVLRECAQDADILIHDAQYTQEEYEKFKGWGHSTWAEAISVARDSNVKQVILMHHDPSHDDDKVTEIVEGARAQFDNVVGGCEGWSISI